LAIREGACRFGLWWVHVGWDGDTVYRVGFRTSGKDGAVPPLIRYYLGGRRVDLNGLQSAATAEGAPFCAVYRAVREIPYGKTATYGEIARIAETSPRLVGVAMRRNPTALVVPCHRVVAQRGIGGFTPDVEIKVALLRMEQKNK
jgi:methylated-DNA-[protein]-cysteine S-methyltransferase